MKYLDYLESTNFYELNELEKVKIILLYKSKVENINEFTMKDICNFIEETGGSRPNTSRLKVKMMASNTFKLNNDFNFTFNKIPFNKLEKTYNKFLEDNEAIISNNEFLDENNFCGYRGYLDKLIYQINSSYKNNCYDACAVLLRRVFEIILILSYRNNEIDSQIKNNDGTYMMLERIVSNAINNSTLNLSRIKKEYHNFRDLGNFSAHRIEYNSSKHDLDYHKSNYRVALEELYYKAGLKK